MKTCMAIMFYNDAAGLHRLIPSLLSAGVPKHCIKAFDGPFDLFPHGGKEKSTDGSRVFLQKQGIKIIDCGIMNHMYKTNYRFEWASTHGFQALIGIDCDEYVLGSWDAFKQHFKICEKQKHRQSYALTFTDLDGFYDTRSGHQRLFLDLGELEYVHEHWKVYKKGDDGIHQITAHWILGGLTILHDSSIRPKNRENQMKIFQDRLKPLEHKKKITMVRHTGRHDG